LFSLAHITCSDTNFTKKYKYFDIFLGYTGIILKKHSIDSIAVVVVLEVLVTGNGVVTTFDVFSDRCIIMFELRTHYYYPYVSQ
jgi:hypothetical protein